MAKVKGEVQKGVLIPIEELINNPRNYKEHPPKQIAKLKASYLRFGQVKDIVAQRGPEGTIIIAGHGFVQMLHEVNSDVELQDVTHVSSTLVPSHWTTEDAEGYMVADNETSNDAETNETALATLLEEQRAAGFDLASLGSSDEELDALLARLGDEIIDENPLEQDDAEAPEDFKSFDEDIDYEYCCPKCSYHWSGKPR